MTITKKRDQEKENEVIKMMNDRKKRKKREFE